ncbi:MAG: hydrogenase formation protein HypD [SAR324 cluster bacterium]|nr:hydrogenase formation protein HypD [SAR324 cluster bacterium]
MGEHANLEKYKNAEYVAHLSKAIKAVSASLGTVKLMHVCGTHEHEIARHGIRQFLPPTIQIIPGPGCPVCICPVESIDQAITLAYQPNTTVLTFGDMVRVPASHESLEDARRNGGSVKMVYSALDAVNLARENPNSTFVFFSIGFETTVVGIAGMIKTGIPKNLYVLLANRYMPPVLKLLMDVHDESIQGFLLAGHAATITGLHAYDFMEDEFQLPCVATGFEPVDILLGIFECLKLIKNKEPRIVNAYPRAVNEHGNTVALQLIEDVFERKPGIWRGIDIVDDSAFRIKEEYSFLDAEKQLDCTPPYPPRSHPPGCDCHRIMLGELLPTNCKMFTKTCTPSNPYGPCMVSPEGTCHTWFKHGSGKISLTHTAAHTI